MSCTIPIRVQPGAKKSAVERDDAGWKIRVAAPPVDGKANEALCRFLAREVLGLPARAVQIKAGAGGRSKLLEVDAEREEVEAALLRAAAAPAR